MIAENIRASVEAILFSSGDAVPAVRMCEVLGCEKSELEAEVDRISAGYIKSGSGLRILKLGDAYQMSTDTKEADVVRACLELRRNMPLSQAAFEVLAVIAYNQPVTKSFVEQVRGVDCSGVISSLSEKNLITEAGRLDLPGRPLLYRTTPDFLRCFSISELSELPPIPQRHDDNEQNTLDEYMAEKLREEIASDNSADITEMSIDEISALNSSAEVAQDFIDEPALD